MDSTSIKIVQPQKVARPKETTHQKISSLIFKHALAWTLFMPSFCCHSEVFTWKDEAGVTHFSHEHPAEKVIDYAERSPQLTYVHMVGETQADKLLNPGNDEDKDSKKPNINETDLFNN